METSPQEVLSTGDMLAIQPTIINNGNTNTNGSRNDNDNQAVDGDDSNNRVGDNVTIDDDDDDVSAICTENQTTISSFQVAMNNQKRKLEELSAQTRDEIAKKQAKLDKIQNESDEITRFLNFTASHTRQTRNINK